MKKYIADEKLIRKSMIDKGIKSIAQLSRISGVSKPIIHDYLSGKTPIASTFIRLCEFLEIDPKDNLIFQGDVTSEKQ